MNRLAAMAPRVKTNVCQVCGLDIDAALALYERDQDSISAYGLWAHREGCGSVLDVDFTCTHCGHTGPEVGFMYEYTGGRGYGMHGPQCIGGHREVRR